MEENNDVQVQETKQVQKKSFLDFFKGFKNQKKQLLRILWLVVALILFLIITNPSIIPFLPDDVKTDIRNAWGNLFGDVSRVANTFAIGWVTLFQIIAIILMMVIITAVVTLILDNVHPKSPKLRSAVSLFRSATSYLTTIIGFFWCLSALGVNISTIFASVGIVALIIGFGAQSLVEDVVTGIFLVFEDQFNVGDIIETDGFRGTVDAIGVRTTSIRDVGNNVKIINNSDLRNILNRSTAASVAVTTVSISYSADIVEVEKVIAKLMPQIKEKYPDVFVSEPRYVGVQNLAESGVELRFAADVGEQDIFSGPRILNREIKIAFDKAGIEIPFNQIVVHTAKD